MKRILLTSILIVGLTPILLGYVVYLRDGSTYMARDKYRVEGDSAIITLQNGTVIKVKLSLIDVKKTREYNAKGITSGEVIALGRHGAGNDDGKKKASTLGSLITRKSTNGKFGKKPNVDLRRGDTKKKNRNTPFKDVALTRSLTILFENQNLFQYKIFQGSGPRALRVEMITDNENEVFKTLSSVARKLTEYYHKDPSIADRVELFMATSAGAPAGRFIIDAEQAQALTDGKITVESFYVENVIF